jgi:hypothetical protein
MPARTRRRKASRTELLHPFATSIHAKVEALKTLDLSPSEKARLREAISDDIKKCTNFCAPSVSRAAWSRARRLGIDLRSQGWHQQHRFDPKRKVFHWEHHYTVARLGSECGRALSINGVLRVLKRARVVWILKAEDARLTKLGFRARRDDPDRAYRVAGIIIRQHS